eukprot:TRINITY_DN1606_c0_g1_i3.p1 TRINITY_DN1606_c0_g1~~TRINITY_DN1606_c0_g1_i3.p1  ORF type:complete len:627 (+),score=170.19 TRINITY_DN1606_c0_g1_i3:69-1883(+)
MMKRIAQNSLRVASAVRSIQGRSCVNLASMREENPIMFCMQCEQTNSGRGCDRIGMCGKRPKVAVLQDVAIHICKGISLYAHAARQLDEVKGADNEIDQFVGELMFATMTNVNNDSDRFHDFIKKAVDIREKAKNLYESLGGQKNAFPNTPATWDIDVSDADAIFEMGEDDAGVLARAEGVDEDTFSLIELITYGAKGMAAYNHHAAVQGFEDPSVYAGLHEVMAATCDPNASVETLLPVALKVGEVNLTVMKLLETAHISSYGTPVPKDVPTNPVEGKCILVSGHDIRDTANILKATEGTGINVYTHGELLPAHGYPELQKFEHFKGHFGGAWQKQRTDFNNFPGPIVMTTNCLIEPKPSYKKRMFTRTVVGWPGIKHIDGEDYSEVIKMAKECDGFSPAGVAAFPAGKMTTGFGADTIISKADAVVGAIKSGAIKNFYVIGGCDGRESTRSYFTNLATSTPDDSVILTLGCGKFRFNQHPFGEVADTGIPRMLDVGQCNDAYGAVRVALALKDALGAGSVNDLPIHFGVSWFEQKAVAVLLTLLHLDIKNIHLGPKLPAFLTPNLVNFLVENYGITPCLDGHADAAKMAQMKTNHLEKAASA